MKLRIRLSNQRLKALLLCLTSVLVNPLTPIARAEEQGSPSIELPLSQEVAQTPQTVEKEQQLETEGEKCFEQREYNKALLKWQEAYGLSLEMKYGDGEGRALTDMCRLYLERGQVVKAKELGENALEVLSSSSNHKAIGKTHVALAQVYLALDNPLWASQQLEQALTSFTELGTNDALECAQVLMLAGKLAQKSGQAKEAVSFYQGAATFYGRSGDSANEVAIRVSLTTMMTQFGWLVAALEEANKALTAARDSKVPDMIATALAAVGQCQFNLGEYANAYNTFQESLLSIKSASPLAVASYQCGFGNALSGVGDLESAKLYLEHALAGFKAEGTAAIQAQATNTLGCVEEMLGHHGRSVQLLNQALELQGISTPGQEKLGIVISQNLGAVYARSGDNRNARSSYQSALSRLNKFNDPVLKGRTLSSLAEVCLNQKDYVQSEAFLKEGIAVSEKINDDAALWRDYTLLANIQDAGQLQTPARESLNSALSHFRSPQAGSFPTPSQLTFPSTKEDLGQQLVSQLVAADLLEPALLAAEQLKEESFINQWQRLGGQVKPEDREIYTDLVTQQAHLHAAANYITPDKLLKDWQTWLSRFQQLTSENRMLARLIAPVPTTYPQLLKEIGASHVTVIDYLVGPRSTLAFVIDGKGKLTAANLPVGRAHLQSQLSEVFSGLGKTDVVNRQTEKRDLHQLFTELLPAQVQSKLPENPDQTIVIIPDGVLFNLPFAALVDAQGKYLIEQHTLTLSSSMGVFLDAPAPHGTDMSVVVTSLNSTSNKKNESSNTESNQISSLFQPEQVTRLKDTDMSNLEEQAKGKSVLHFSSSVVLPETNPLYSTLPFVPVKGDKETKVFARGLFGLNLPSDLSVWSGTMISSKDLQGNAVRIFSRGLNYAGARNVLMSLWMEPDVERTGQLVEFYKSNQQGLSQAQSLRRAQLAAVSKDQPLRSWAAFQLLGPGF